MELSPDIALEQAVAQHRAGARVEAEQLYRAVLAAQPRQPTANHNLAILLAERGEAQAALALFHAALEAEPSQGQYWISYAKALLAAGLPADAAALLEQGQGHGLKGPIVDALLAEARKAPAASLESQANRLAEAGRFDEAATVFVRALEKQPDNAALHVALGDALSEAGRGPEAIEAYRAAIACDDGFAEAWFHLGGALTAAGDIEDGFAAYMRRAELTYGAGKVPPPPDKPHPLHRLRHDQAQRDYLVKQGLVPADAKPGEIFHLAPGARLDGPAVNPANATPALDEQWRGNWPQMVVIDDFLTPEALASLRRYCAQSTVWKRNYQAGYIGATPQDGFACPLLAQIAQEIRTTFAAMLKAHQLQYLGAFKYDSELSTGTNTHADFSAVNVNFYIAPDEANLDPASGGMRIWDIAARDEAELRHYNGDDAAAVAHVKAAKATIVPHRANRAVIFRSDIFHKTDDCRFADGYLNMRINISLLYGRHGDLA